MMNETTHIKFVNTSMHGVSDFFVKRAFSVFGFAPYTPVKEQQFPDAEFPTVRFPNPEEKGCQIIHHHYSSLKSIRVVGV